MKSYDVVQSCKHHCCDCKLQKISAFTDFWGHRQKTLATQGIRLKIISPYLTNNAHKCQGCVSIFHIIF